MKLTALIVVVGLAVLRTWAQFGPLVSVKLVDHAYGTNGAAGIGITNNIYYFGITNNTGSWLRVMCPRIEAKVGDKWHEVEGWGEFDFNLRPHGSVVVHQHKPFLNSWRVSFPVVVLPDKHWISQKPSPQWHGVQYVYEE